MDENKIDNEKSFLVKVYRYIMHMVKDPVFGVAVSIAIIMWFLNNISEEFTTVISVPVEIVGVVDGDSDRTFVDPKKSNVFDVDCRVSGRGYNIIYYSVLGKIKLNAADLPIDKESEEYTIETKMLEDKMSEQMTRLRLISVFRKKLTFKTVTYNSKIVPIRANVTLRNDGEYMPIGSIQFEPLEVKISGSAEKLKSIKEVETEDITVAVRKNFISGEVKIKPIPDIDISSKQVYFSMNFQRYTEVKVLKRVEIVGAAKGVIYSVVPSHVETVFNVAENVYHDFNDMDYKIFVNLNDKKENIINSTYIGSNKFVVQYGELPNGVRIQSIDPIYVTVLKGNVEDMNTDEKFN